MVVAAQLLLPINVLWAADLHPFYLMKDNGGIAMNANGKVQANPYDIEQAKQAKDCRPADLDPEGNWGFITEGMQLGLRFEAAIFTNGQDIRPSFYIRNVSDKLITYESDGPEDLAFGITIVRLGGETALRSRAEETAASFNPPRERTLWVSGHPDPSLFPGTQRKHKVWLNRTYKLVPGRYSINGTVQFFPGTNRLVKGAVTSGAALFEIVAPYDGAGGTNTAASPQTNANANPGQPLPPSNAPPPPSASGNPAGTDTTSGNASQNQTHAIPGQPAPSGAVPGATGNKTSASATRNVLWSGALAGLVLFGVLGLWLLRRRKT